MKKRALAYVVTKPLAVEKGGYARMMSAGLVTVLTIIRTHKIGVRIKFQKVPNSGSQIYILFANLFCQDCAENGADKFPCVAKGWWGKITLSAPPVAAFDIQLIIFNK